MPANQLAVVQTLPSLAQTYELVRQELQELRVRNPNFGLGAIYAILGELRMPHDAILGDMMIEAAMHDGLIVIDPFEPRLMGSSSYDVRLGRHYWKARTDGDKRTFSPFGPNDVRHHFDGPHEAVLHSEWCATNGYQLFEGIDPDEYIIPLEAGHTILAHTHEFIGFLYGGTTMMKAKSSTGRVDISVCDDAGWGDVGYVNRWTLEVRNKHTRSVVALPVGMPFGQLIFMWVQGAAIHYGLTGNYQSGLDIDEIKSSWSPDDMLPRGFLSQKNRDIRQILSKLDHDRR